MLLEFASAVEPITVVVGYDTDDFVYPNVVAEGSVAMNAQFPLQSITVTPTGITANQFTFTENTRTIVVHGGVNFASLVGATISLAITLTNQAGDTHVYQQTINVVTYVTPSLTDAVLAPIIIYRGEPRSI